MSTDDTASSAAAPAVRRFGRFELLELVGRSSLSMAWLVRDPRDRAEKLMWSPRTQPPGGEATLAWLREAERASRVGHPGVARPIETGDHQGWPFLLYRPEGRPLSVRLAASGAPGAPMEVAALFVSLCRALASAHDAGVIHGDLQPWSIWVVGLDKVRLHGFEVASPPMVAAHLAPGDPRQAQRVREGVSRDLACLGVLLHWMLTGRAPWGRVDVSEVLDRVGPQGAEVLRLPVATELPLPKALRVIADRATDRRVAYRYRSVRTLLTALEGWLDEKSGSGRGFLLEVKERLRASGGLPIHEETRERFQRIEQLENEPTGVVADLMLDDLALCLELLRGVNAQQQRDERRAGSASVLTLKRAVAMVGLRGVRRVATGLKRWPGGLKPHEVAPLEKVMDRCRSAARVAQGLRPPGFDAEIVYVITVLQNLGRIVLHHLFPEQAGYVRSLMTQDSGLAGASVREGEVEMTEETACLAVLGVDMEAITAQALQFMGLDATARAICRRMPLGVTIHPSRVDDDLLRMTASCAIEAIDALQGSPQRTAVELSTVLQRYGRALRVDLPTLKRLLLPHGLEGAALRAWVARTPGARMDPGDDLL
jgi:non-specific serine/threonine protein kinase